MRRKQEHRHIVDILFVLALFGLFTISALMLVTVGAEVYRNTVEDMDSNYEARTSFAYLTEKIRQNDATGSVSIGMLENIPALILSQTIDDQEYLTYLYYHEGCLKELLMKKGADLVGDPLSAGNTVMPLAKLDMALAGDSLISFRLTTLEGQEKSLLISTRSQ